ncbi:flagellar protein FlaG [Candidatus Galacturonibacter soehngenii]|uniref:Flagellar protein FlaG n=1 Tax=Candidatus Galacturonatibacter soehngenii TaxID=2307010 RepID=A0A7V7QHC7_9FIRM|nr:flagellar protein FlaG [Candidatus Galacturonibacter soehngenii]KAB1434323.1 flagellar protein FlaG [Candidatus Galacturonibacter soehngenii]
MELDLVNKNAYQGSSTKVNVKPVQQVISGRAGDRVEGITTDALDGLNHEKSVVNHANDITNSEIKKSISEINSKLNKNTEAIFGIHDETNRVTIKIIDKDSKEVLKEIPPEKTLEMITKVWEAAGLLVDEKL